MTLRPELGNKVRRLWWLIPILTLASCGREERGYFPLDTGASWTYAVRTGFLSEVESVRVVRPMPVSGVMGWELSGPMGTSRLAWKGGALRAEELAGTRFSPAIPILVPMRQAFKKEWSGMVTTAAANQEAAATLVQVPDTISIAGRKYMAIKATLTLWIGKKQLEQTTVYGEGIGPLRQEQHVNGVQERYLDYLSGP